MVAVVRAMLALAQAVVVAVEDSEPQPISSQKAIPTLSLSAQAVLVPQQAEVRLLRTAPLHHSFVPPMAEAAVGKDLTTTDETAVLEVEPGLFATAVQVFREKVTTAETLAETTLLVAVVVPVVPVVNHQPTLRVVPAGRHLQMITPVRQSPIQVVAAVAVAARVEAVQAAQVEPMQATVVATTVEQVPLVRPTEVVAAAEAVTPALAQQAVLVKLSFER